MHQITKRNLDFVFSQLSWLSVDFNNWKDWEEDSDEEMGNFDQFSDVSAVHLLGWVK